MVNKNQSVEFVCPSCREKFSCKIVGEVEKEMNRNCSDSVEESIVKYVMLNRPEVRCEHCASTFRIVKMPETYIRLRLVGK